MFLVNIWGVVHNKDKIKNLEGIEIFQNLIILNCIDCDLTNIDISKNVNLEKLNVRKTNLKELDVSKNVNLKILICSNTGISNLDISNNSLLKQLEISTTYIKNVELSNNTYNVYIRFRATDNTTLPSEEEYNEYMRDYWKGYEKQPNVKLEWVDLPEKIECKDALQKSFAGYNVSSSEKDIPLSDCHVLLDSVYGNAQKVIVYTD